MITDGYSSHDGDDDNDNDADDDDDDDGGEWCCCCCGDDMAKWENGKVITILRIISIAMQQYWWSMTLSHLIDIVMTASNI